MTIVHSLIIPIYNEADGILEMYRRVAAVMDRLDGESELILIDDGSRDRSLEMMRGLANRDPRVGYLSLARNFGHQVAVTAGLDFARGRVIVILDADLQDPPELIPAMLERWREGNHVVYAQRTTRLKETWFKKWSAHVFYRVLRRLSDVEIPTDTGDFCLMDRAVVDVLNRMPERNRYIRGLRSWVGFRQTAIPFERDPRFAGEAKYTFRKSLMLAINGLVSFSKAPLRFAVVIGLAGAAASVLMGLVVLYWRLFQPGSPVQGYTIILMTIFFFCSVLLLSIGILGEYVGQIYDEVKARPLYTLAEVRGFESATDRTTSRAMGSASGARHESAPGPPAATSP